MLRAAASNAGRAYKQQLIDLLDIARGQTALDVGCGPGTDLPALAERVGEHGTVIGIDRDPAMLAQARERATGLHGVEVCEGDAHALPIHPGSVDRAKIDRVLMHVEEPDAALAQLHRARRPRRSRRA
ncbi:methyltransferase domain-containing protein [Streptomyces sp. NBC_00878]|nr:methyltransferase domain-containing protein [Streptomyces sp. NBC_00878]